VCRHVRAEGRALLTVLGDGPVGLLASQILAGRNPSVRLLGRHESRFTLAERWGIKHRHESEAGRRRDQDVVVDCTGSPGGVALASRLVRPRGMIVVKGPPHAEALGAEGLWPADLGPLLASEVTLRSATTLNVREGLDLIASGKVDPLPLLSRRVPLSRLADALAPIAPGGPPLTIVEM
jgi:alcohol dehydrogenase